MISSTENVFRRRHLKLAFSKINKLMVRVNLGLEIGFGS